MSNMLPCTQNLERGEKVKESDLLTQEDFISITKHGDKTMLVLSTLSSQVLVVDLHRGRAAYFQRIGRVDMLIVGGGSIRFRGGRGPMDFVRFVSLEMAEYALAKWERRAEIIRPKYDPFPQRWNEERFDGKEGYEGRLFYPKGHPFATHKMRWLPE